MNPLQLVRGYLRIYDWSNTHSLCCLPVLLSFITIWTELQGFSCFVFFFTCNILSNDLFYTVRPRYVEKTESGDIKGVLGDLAPHFHKVWRHSRDKIYTGDAKIFCFLVLVIGPMQPEYNPNLFRLRFWILQDITCKTSALKCLKSTRPQLYNLLSCPTLK